MSLWRRIARWAAAVGATAREWWSSGAAAESWLGSGGGERHRTGWRAEDYAAANLTRLGYHILGRNVEVGPDEIDIVAEHDRTLVFVEVRSRRDGSPIRPSSTLTREKRRRILYCGRAYMRARRLGDVRHRFDIAEVYLNADGRPCRFEVIEAGVTDPADD